jgi:probable O-glycosylation ligase (exosortase A-associated)
MRDIVILAIVLVGAAAALRRPWIGVMLWTWISIMNPHRFAWGIAYSAPVAAVAAGATLAGLLFTKDKASPFKGAPVWWLTAFTIWMAISWLAGIDPAGDYVQWNKVMKIYLMTFVALALLHSRYHVMAFAWVTVGSLALLGIKGGIFTIVTGGNSRVWGPPGGFIEGNNEFALAIIVAVPMMYFLYSVHENRWLRLAIISSMVLCVVSALGTHSRGALLAAIAMGAVLWWRSHRKALLAILMLAFVAVYVPTLPDHWWDRMETIKTYEQDGSAMGRINAWHVAWETAKRYPAGGGMSYQHAELFNEFGVYETVVRAAHSIYFQVLGNHGFMGLLLYLGLWISTFRMAGRLRVEGKGNVETEWVHHLGAMVQASLAAFAVGGAFLSLSYFDLPYNLMVMVVCARQWLLNHQAAAVDNSGASHNLRRASRVSRARVSKAH